MGQCGGLERTELEQFLLWNGVEVGVVGLKVLILNNFYFGRCGGLGRTTFEQFLLWNCVEVGMVVLKELIFNSFYFGRVLRY